MDVENAVGKETQASLLWKYCNVFCVCEVIRCIFDFCNESAEISKQTIPDFMLHTILFLKFWFFVLLSESQLLRCHLLQRLSVLSNQYNQKLSRHWFIRQRFLQRIIQTIVLVHRGHYHITIHYHVVPKMLLQSANL